MKKCLSGTFSRLDGRRALYVVRTNDANAAHSPVVNDVPVGENVPDWNIEDEPLNNKTNIRRLIKRIRTLYLARDPEFLETLALMRELIADDELRDDFSKAA